MYGVIGALIIFLVAALLALKRRSSPRPDPQTGLLGRTFGRYRLVQKLGSGGMGAVYRALPLEGGLPVAIKVVDPSLGRDAVFRGRFEREARVSSELSHPNLVQVLAWGEESGMLYLVMELVPGQTLRQRLRDSIPVSEALAILKQMVDGMAHAHAHGCVHRDLKPVNVMITPAGQARILDFGLARRSDFHTLTRTGQVLGTIGYGAPEQLSGKPGDERADQYALGVVAYEMLTGRQPFKGKLTALASGTVKPAPIEGVPQPLAAAVMRMMARAPEERFPDLKAVQQALAEAVPA